MQTISGKIVDPSFPVPEDFDLLSIASGLVKICRYAGQIPTFYSVGQHSVVCAALAYEAKTSERIILGCLFHDASEAFLGDVPKPIKDRCPDYRAIEADYEACLRKTLKLPEFTEEERKQIKHFDRVAMYHEVLNFFPKPAAVVWDPLVQYVTGEVGPTHPRKIIAWSTADLHKTARIFLVAANNALTLEKVGYNAFSVEEPFKVAGLCTGPPTDRAGEDCLTHGLFI